MGYPLNNDCRLGMISKTADQKTNRYSCQIHKAEGNNTRTPQTYWCKVHACSFHAMINVVILYITKNKFYIFTTINLHYEKQTLHEKLILMVASARDCKTLLKKNFIEYHY